MGKFTHNKLDHLHVLLLNQGFFCFVHFVLCIDLFTLCQRQVLLFFSDSFLFLTHTLNAFAWNNELKHLLTHTFNLFAGKLWYFVVTILSSHDLLSLVL